MLTRSRSKTSSSIICDSHETDRKRSKCAKTLVIQNENAPAKHENIVQPNLEIDNLAKKISISKDEMLLPGAPQTDLFDVVVQDDDELMKTAEYAHPCMDMALACTSIKETSEWAKKYSSIEILRKIVLKYPSTVQPDNISGIIDAAISEMESLRSCSIRNSLLLLRALVLNFNEFVETYSVKIVEILFLKSSSGPRFIMEQSFTVLTQFIESMSPQSAIPPICAMTNHRNADLAAKAVTMLCTCVMRMSQSDHCALQSANGLLGLYQSLHEGINSKRVAAKESSREAVKHLNTVCSATGGVDAVASAATSSTSGTSSTLLSVMTTAGLAQIKAADIIRTLTDKAAMAPLVCTSSSTSSSFKTSIALPLKSKFAASSNLMKKAAPFTVFECVKVAGAGSTSTSAAADATASIGAVVSVADQKHTSVVQTGPAASTSLKSRMMMWKQAQAQQNDNDVLEEVL